MSALIYLASDTNLKEVKSPHNKTMSVNEALALGIEIPDILNSQAIDKDKPDMILWTDSYTESKEGGLLVDSGFADDISILQMKKWRTCEQRNNTVPWWNVCHISRNGWPVPPVFHVTGNLLWKKQSRIFIIAM